MVIVHRFLMWLTARLPCRLIDVNGQPYLQRYHVGTIFGWVFDLHRFVAADGDRSVHDHPWPAVSFILTGWYDEERPTQIDHERGGLRLVTTRRRAGTINRLDPDDFHRVIRVRPDTWTLFCHGPRVKGWGFLRTEVRRYPVVAGRAHPPDLILTYTEAESSPADWHTRAPTGADARRLT